MNVQTILSSLGLSEQNHGIYSANSGWLSGSGSLTSQCPGNGETIASTSQCSDAEYEVVVTESLQAFRTWRAVPAPQRGEAVRLIGDALRQHKSALGDLVALEMGKSKQEADGEVQEMIDIADFAVGQSRMLYGNTMHSERPQHRLYEQWHPLGPVAVISAFNFPVAVWSWNAFIAAVAGNTVIWKPSPKTPLSAIAVQHICAKVMAENNLPQIFSLFISDSTALSEKFVGDTRLPLVSFTGSTAVGKKVNEIVARRLGRCLLELGGNNAIIVDETANLDLAIPAIVFGAVGTAGQRCTTTRRLFVHKSQIDNLIQRLVNAYQQVTVGDPLDQRNLMGPLIDQQAVDSFLDAIVAIKAAGGEVLVGGEAITQPGYFVQPTLVRAENHWDIVQTETFAPILYVMAYDKLDEAVTMQNAVPQGLSSAIFTDRMQHAEQFLSAVGSDCGIANVNIGTSGAEIGGAFGGEKDTGGGREAGSDAWKAYMRRQTNTLNWSAELPLAQGIKFDLG